MSNIFKIANLFFLVNLLLASTTDAQQKTDVTMPTVEQLATHFQHPAPEYGPTVTWGWQGPVDSTVINRDLDSIKEIGFRMVTIEGGYKMTYPYLSPGYFKLIKYAVEAAKKRDMRVWLIDEGKYPTGFAGGLFSEKRPDLRMQALIPAEHIAVTAGQHFFKKLSPDVLSAVAYNGDTSITISIKHNKINWTAPSGQGDWQVLIVKHAFKTSPTRASNNPTGAKDTKNSLCDYLNPKAAKQFLAFTHEQYKKYIGDEFGKTVIGFRSDEPAFSYTPWTPDMLEIFKKQKGYDIRPYLAAFFIHNPTEAEKRAKADYWEVSSNLFRDNFFKVISGWCVKNNLEYEQHIDHDGPEDAHTMLELARSEGDYFKDMRYLQIPGIDVIWHQLWPGEANNFPKLASSAAHLFGRPQVFSESFAAFKPKPNIPQVKWVLNEQLARDVNLFEIMFYAASTSQYGGPHGFMASDSFPTVMRALNRKAYVLANGRPAAKTGLYFPTPSLWLRDTIAINATWKIAKALLNHQRDFDFVDDQSLSDLMKIKDGRFVNLSGQGYQTIIIPPVKTISGKIVARLKAFQKAGGKVIFMGNREALEEGRDFFNANVLTDLSWAGHIPSDTMTAQAFDALPQPAVSFNENCKAIKYTQRHLKDGEVYFFFNESGQRQEVNAKLQGAGQIQLWNPANGDIALEKGVNAGKGFVEMRLVMAPYEAKIIVIDKNNGHGK